MDPRAVDVIEAVKATKTAGLRIIMITGDFRADSRRYCPRYRHLAGKADADYLPVTTWII